MTTSYLVLQQMSISKWLLNTKCCKILQSLVNIINCVVERQILPSKQTFDDENTNEPCGRTPCATDNTQGSLLSMQPTIIISVFSVETKSERYSMVCPAVWSSSECTPPYKLCSISLVTLCPVQTCTLRGSSC